MQQMTLLFHSSFLEPDGKESHEEDGRYSVEEVKGKYQSNFSHIKASNSNIQCAELFIIKILYTAIESG